MKVSHCLLFAPLTSAATIELVKRQSECTAVHIFLAGGNNEPYPGRQGVLVNAICAGLPSCDYEDIVYDHSLASNYCTAVGDGAAAGISQITAYNARCPDSNLVVSGYSQGGQVAGDIIGGGGGTFFQDCVQVANAGLDINSAPGNKIIAVTIFGDVRHVADQSYNQLTGAGGNGLYPRFGSELDGLNAYSSHIHSYCVFDDPICAGGDVVADHLNYFDIYTDAAAAWVQSMIPTTTSTTSSSASATTSTASSSSVATSTQSATTDLQTAYTSVIAIPTQSSTVVVTVSSVVATTTVCPSSTTVATTSSVAIVATASGVATVAATSSVPTTTKASNGTVVATPSPSISPFTGGASVVEGKMGLIGLAVMGALAFAL